jgi:hypothetical protein
LSDLHGLHRNIMEINALLAQLDNYRRVAGQNALATMQDPAAHFQNSLARYAHESLPSRLDTQDAQSVMPGMGNALMNKIGNLATNSMLPAMTVWHGSPHLFDKFDSSKIGTGEGAQVYGHGIYVAENPKVAGGYRTALSGRGGPLLNGIPIDTQRMRLSSEESMLANMYSNRLAAGLSPDKAAEQTTMWGAMHPQIGPQASSDIVSRLSPPPKGAVYKVDLADEHIAKMLDWDKPLSEQTDVIKQLGITERGMHQIKMIGGEDSVRGLLEYIAAHHANTAGSKGITEDARAEASKTLADRGIPGIKYLDQGSRDAGKGTRNFVVFDDSLLKILGRE